MFQKHNITSFFIFLIVFNANNKVTAEDILELSCSDRLTCKQFEHSGITAACVDGHCQCTSLADVHTPCRPSPFHKNNIIGGLCPCTQPHAECDVEEDTCYCEKGYESSADRRRCINQIVPLSSNCEHDKQCQNADSFALCHLKEQKCRCQEGFIEFHAQCVSLVGLNATQCEIDSDCEMHGAEVVCATEAQQCICPETHVRAPNGTTCLNKATFNETCSSGTQCRSSLGTGGACIGGQCLCQKGYFPTIVNGAEGTKQHRTKCVPLVVLGKYCRANDGCYQQQLSLKEQSMVCDRGECNCKLGYKPHKNMFCVNGGHKLYATCLLFTLVLPLIIIWFY